jgi:hypothetical protein
MNSQQSKIPDEARSHLRSVVTAVDGEISQLAQVRTGEPSVTTDRLKEKWKELIGLLALGPEPEYRECPFCHNVGMRFASQCGFCWKKLPPFMSALEEPGKRS